MKEDSEAQHRKVDHVEGQPVKKALCIKMPDQVDGNTDEDNNIKPWTPVHPVGWAFPLCGLRRSFVELELIHQLRLHDESLFRRWMHQCHQDGDGDDNDERED